MYIDKVDYRKIMMDLASSNGVRLYLSLGSLGDSVIGTSTNLCLIL
jgi:hypothetical protein